MAKGRKTGGRVAGTPNKTTTALKEAILAAADQAGDELSPNGGKERYLKWLASTNSGAFASLLGKVLPTELAGSVALIPHEQALEQLK